MIESVLRLEGPVPPVLAAGAWFKNAVCGARGAESRIGGNAGDLDTAEACVRHEQEVAAMLAWLGEPPRVIAHDLHPDFHSSRHAAELAARMGVPAIPVQHHHAHIAAICAEWGLDRPVIGLALDGVGLGTDDTPWGGELLRVDGAHFERLGHLQPLALPGGDKAAKEPWRMAAAVLHDLGRGGEIGKRYAHEAAASTVVAMLGRNLNCPRTSSAGRLFDAASGLLRLCERMTMDAEGAVALEQAATRYVAAAGWPAAPEDAWRIDGAGRLDLGPLLGRLADETDADFGAALFHSTLIEALAAWAGRAAEATGLADVALGGGCFFNRLLNTRLPELLESRGLRAWLPRRLVPGDATLAAGQAWVAIKSLEA